MRLLGGVLKGEMLLSVSSAADGSGAVSLSSAGFARLAGLLGTFGFAARLTGGGPVDFGALGLASDVGIAGLFPVICGLMGSESFMNALILFSKLGVAPRLMLRT